MAKQRVERNYCSRNTAVGLLEVMVVVGVIAALVLIAMPNYRIFSAKAIQANAKTNMRQIASLVSAWDTENGLENYPVLANENLTDLNAAPLTSTSCQLPNNLNFNLSDCTKARYNYWIFLSRVGGIGSEVTGWAVHATHIPSSTIPSIIGSSCPGGAPLVDWMTYTSGATGSGEIFFSMDLLNNCF